MGLKKYTIAFRIDDAMAQAAIKRSLSGLDAIDKAAKRAAKSLGDAFDKGAAAAQRAANAQVAVANSMATRQTKAATTEAERRAKQVQAIEDAYLKRDYNSRVAFEKKKAAQTDREAARATAAEQRKATALEAIESKFIANDYRRRTTHQARLEKLNRKLLTDEQINARVRNALIDQTNRKRIDAAMKAAGVEGGTLEKVRDAAGGATRAILGISAGIGVLGTVHAVGSKVVEVLEQANAKAREEVDRLLETKDLIREIVMIQGGREGPTDAEVNRFMAIRKASGLSAHEAKEFSLEFEGAGAAARGKNIPEAEYDRLKPMLGRFAAAAGGGPGAAGTYGKLGGLLLGLGHYNKAEDVLAAETQFNRILSKGVGDNPTLIKQQAQVAGAYISEEGRGTVKDANELAAITATASRINPEQAAEVMKSTTRVFRGFGEKWDPLLQKVGITEKDTYAEAANKIFGHLEQVEKSGRSVDAYLKEQGVDAHGATNTLSMYRYRKFLNDTLKEEAEKMTGGQAVAQLNEKYAGDVTLRTKQKEAAFEEARLANAMPNQFAKEMELEARTRLEQRGEGEDMAAAGWKDWAVGIMANPLPWGDHTKLGRKIRVEQEMNRIAQERGLSVPGRPNDTSLFGFYPSGYLGWLMGGQDLGAYSAAGFEKEQRDKAAGARPKIPPGAMPLPKGGRAALLEPGGAGVPAPMGGLGDLAAAMGPEGFGGGLGDDLRALTVALRENTSATQQNTPAGRRERIKPAPSLLPGPPRVDTRIG